MKILNRLAQIRLHLVPHCQHKTCLQWLPVIALLCLLQLGVAQTAQADSAGQVLRAYLSARTTGDLETAQGLWNRQEMRRARAMGMRYSLIEASFDDYWLMSSEERQQFVQENALAVRESVVTDDKAHFTVEVLSRQSGTSRDRWSYTLRREAATWSVALAPTQTARSWTRREGRFVVVRSRRVVHVNSDAVNAMDHHIEALFAAFNTSKAAQLRLERVKYEIFVCEEKDIAKLIGSPSRLGYLPANERIVTLAIADMSAITTAVANLTLRKTAPVGAAFFEKGLATAWGGHDEVNGEVVLLRARNALLRGETTLDLPFTSPEHRAADDVGALWNYALGRILSAEAFMELYGSFRGTSLGVQSIATADIRNAIEVAVGSKGQALNNRVLQELKQFDASIVSGCEEWPPDTRNLRSVLEWRDQDSQWGLRAYDKGKDFAVALGAHRAGISDWVYEYADSVARAHGLDGVNIDRPPVPGRPSGDPPYMVVTFMPRLDLEPEPFVSSIYEKLFSTREYENELHSFFVSHDLVQVYDYRINKLIAEYDVETAAPGDALFYDEEQGRVCFIMHKSVFRRPIVEYTPRAGLYTGE
jgi:hypothetical protein